MQDIQVSSRINEIISELQSFLKIFIYLFCLMLKRFIIFKGGNKLKAEKKSGSSSTIVLAGLIVLLLVTVIGTLLILSKVDALDSGVTVVSEEAAGTVGVIIEEGPNVGGGSTDTTSGEVGVIVEEGGGKRK
jgi:hypothetical protein